MRHRMATSLLYGAAVYHALGEEALAIVWGMIEICVFFFLVLLFSAQSD